MRAKTVNAIRDLALSYEEIDISIAFELMGIAYNERPDGPLIKHKYNIYKERIENENRLKRKLSNLVDKGKVAIIPIGFRCFTSMQIKNKLGISQASLPFDSGFFPPVSIANIFSNQEVRLDETNHAPCIKFENDVSQNENGISFHSSNYNKINKITSKKDIPNINRYLDSTFGYYTLDKINKFVLAHYNWHTFSNEKISKGIKNPEENIPIINNILNKRIKRMIEMCEKSEITLFIHYEDQNYNFMKIDDEKHILNDFRKLTEILDRKYSFNYRLINLANTDIRKITNTLNCIS